MKDNKVFLSIDLIKPGMVTADVIFNKFGSILVWEDVTLNESMILHLQNMGVQFVPVYKDEMQPEQDQNNDLMMEPSQQLEAGYERNIDITKEIFHEISAGRALDMGTANQVIGSVMDRAKDNRFIVDSVMKVRRMDEYTYYHSLNVSMLCMMIGKWLRLDEVNVRNVTLAGLLHDIGKAMIPISILNKPGKLTPGEFAEMKRHSEYGYNMVSNNSEIHSEVAAAVLTHHEKEDGSGYPLGLKSDKLNIYSKIITVADIFDAMTANRTYKGKDTPLKVFDLMQNGSFGILDPIVLKTFLENIANYYLGVKVRLNTGDTGEVVFMNSMDLAHPVVIVNGNYIDTSISKRISIEEFI